MFKKEVGRSTQEEERNNRHGIVSPKNEFNLFYKQKNQNLQTNKI